MQTLRSVASHLDEALDFGASRNSLQHALRLGICSPEFLEAFNKVVVKRFCHIHEGLEVSDPFLHCCRGYRYVFRSRYSPRSQLQNSSSVVIENHAIGDKLRRNAIFKKANTNFDSQVTLFFHFNHKVAQNLPGLDEYSRDFDTRASASKCNCMNCSG